MPSTSRVIGHLEACWRRTIRRCSMGVGAGCLLLGLQCTFPEYDLALPPVAGGMGAGATSGATFASGGIGIGATSASGGSDGGRGGAGAVAGSSSGTDNGNAGASGLAGAGGTPNESCPGEQWPVEHCLDVCLQRFPAHCYDGVSNGDELAVDCGGSCQGCTLEACAAASDCLSAVCDVGGTATCVAPLKVGMTPHETSSLVGSTTWTLHIENTEPASGKAFALSNLKVRYYFDRRGLAEPLVVRSTQSNLHLASGAGVALAKTRWSIERFEHQEDSAYDAYLEVTFGDARDLFPGDDVELYQQLTTGDSGRSLFDQRANYSYSDEAQPAWLRVTVFYDDKLVWGLEPKPANPRTCFARGVNLNGGQVSVDGRAWDASAQVDLTHTGSGVSQGGTAFPSVASGTATMLSSAVRLQAGHELSLTTEKATYLLYLWATSPGTDAQASDLIVQGQAPVSSGSFRAQVVDNGLVWARLGPYRVDADAGVVTVGVTKGAINLAGLELWYPN